MKDELKGYIFAFIALFSWGIHGPAGRYLALKNVDVYFIFSFRFVIGVLVFFTFLFFKKKLQVNWREDFWLVFVTALLGLFGNSLLYHLSLYYLPATLVMILENLNPIFVFLLNAVFIGIKPRKNEYTALLLSFIGLFLIVAGKGQLSNLEVKYGLGVLLGVLTGISFGIYTFLSGKVVKPFKKDPDKVIGFLFKIFTLSALMGLPFLIWHGELPHNKKEWFWMFEMGLFQSGLSYLCWNYALMYLRTNVVSLLFLFAIVFTSLNEILFLGLSLNLYLILGSILILLSSLLLQGK